MRLKSIKNVGVGLALAAGLTLTAKAQMVYTWVAGPGSAPSSGTLTLDGSGNVISLIFTEPSGTYLNFTPAAGSGTGVVPVTGSSDVTLTGNSMGTDLVKWDPSYSPFPNVPAGLLEQQVEDTFGVGGDWVPVSAPEPTTMLSAVLMLLPFGASTLRILGRKRAA